MGTNMIRVLQELLELARRNKNRHQVTIYSTILGELQRINKNCITKLEFTTWLKSQFKAIETAVDKANEHGVAYDPDHEYLYILADLEYKYALKQMTDVQIRDFFARELQTNPGANKGQLMKAIKEYYNGRYDGKVAAMIVSGFFETK